MKSIYGFRLFLFVSLLGTFTSLCRATPLYSSTITIDCPANLTVSCQSFNRFNLAVHGNAKPDAGGGCLDETKVYLGVKGLSHRVSFARFDTSCNKGTVVRTFTAHDCQGGTATCTQTIVVEQVENYYVRFPDDRLVTMCDPSGIYGSPSFFGEDCELLATSFVDDTARTVPDACYYINRTWRIINWCTYDPICGLTEVPNPTPNAALNAPENFVGPVVSDLCNAPGSPWAASKVKVNATDAAPTNFCSFWGKPVACTGANGYFNGYKYTQVIKVIGMEDPTAQCKTLDGCDSSPNDANLWNEAYWWDQRYETHDLPEAPIELSLTATDACSGGNLRFSCVLLLDLDGDNIQETAISSENFPPANAVYYQNALNPNFSGGTLRVFDKRTVPDPALDKYRFALEITRSGKNTTAALRFTTTRNPQNYVLPELPYGTHQIKWIVQDECGGETACEQTFKVRDCKTPTVVCKPLSVNVMPTKMITLWASDFLEYTFDNATPENRIAIAVSTGEPPPSQFPVDAVTGLPITSATFTCANLGPNVVQLWSKDLDGNTEYCQVVLLVQDNAGNCVSKPIASGTVQSENGEGIEEFTIKIVGNHPAFPPIYPPVIITNGTYTVQYNGLPFPGSGQICPEKTDNPLNGVTTLDLAIIARHILGEAKLPSPYKLIAADANKSNTITTFDVVEIRKLILGIYDELPLNKSWRFIPKSFVFGNPMNPFQTAFPECVDLATFLNIPSPGAGDFIGVKIGDVNGTALGNNLAANEDRSTWPANSFSLKDRPLLPGDAVEVTFEAETALLGQQFTLEHPGLQLLEIVPRSPEIDLDNFAQFPARHLLTHAWNSVQPQGERPAFALRFRALEAGRLSQMLRLSDAVTPSEAYAPGNTLEQPVFLRPSLQFAPTEAKDAVQLLQNQPNPFGSATNIPFYLPQAGAATLRVFDASGKLLHEQSDRFDKGWHQWTVSQQALGAQTGLLTYTLETNGVTLSKAMLLNK